MIRYLLSAFATKPELHSHPLPPCSIGDLVCPCTTCFDARKAQIQAACARLRETHWAFAPADNDGDDEMGAWVQVLRMRASLIPGVAPWAPGADDALTMSADYEEIVGAESGVRELPAEADASQRPTSRPPAMPNLRSA